MQTRRPVMLVVLDGWGWRDDAADNAVRQARTPTFDRLWASCPHAFLRTSGEDVGLPPGQMGNSEVGHLNIGAGRLVMQDLPRINHAVARAEILAQANLPTVVHAFTDGRDTPPRSARDDIARLLKALPSSVPIATVSGRYYAMDRDKRWERVAKAYRAIVDAEGPRFPDADAVIADAYAHDLSDEFVVPAVVGGYRG